MLHVLWFWAEKCKLPMQNYMQTLEKDQPYLALKKKEHLG